MFPYQVVPNRVLLWLVMLSWIPGFCPCQHIYSQPQITCFRLCEKLRSCFHVHGWWSAVATRLLVVTSMFYCCGLNPVLVGFIMWHPCWLWYFNTLLRRAPWKFRCSLLQCTFKYLVGHLCLPCICFPAFVCLGHISLYNRFQLLSHPYVRWYIVLLISNIRIWLVVWSVIFHWVPKRRIIVCESTPLIH